ncbi:MULTISPECIES: ubiquinone biosynthesis protein COQ4 [Sphingomonadaceae]|jgi:ubiquinone biosynthesis protein COQ4|uniref:ubiquinone biosynthesis protein COQ4 n=1 Tax=Sphingomonadales TaxID=204457 RepID=UPI000AE624D8|nr:MULTISPECIES: ubiquinone biosynthesis protein COQ4 [Sphingomonadaceae]MCW1384648.1 ubiquinone biosynthesis protein COQ4 [Novosphingobium sp. KCTC 2891]|tara:strand:+ start:44 stop:841 length:798 start_codon:yes stop_codon:yes gene_type:complete
MASEAKMQGLELKRRIRPVEAFSAMKVLLRDKEDTAQVFRIVEALAGNSYYHHFRRFAESEGGRRILASRSNLLEHLRDRERLARCPIGSLGQRYLAFVYGEGLSADGLVEASKVGGVRSFVDPDVALFRNRMRDSHDLYHIVTGYGRDGLGEICVLTFGNAQFYNHGIAFLLLLGLFKSRREHPELPVLGPMIEAWRRGRSARNFSEIQWEEFLDRPLEEVRAALLLAPAPRYRAAEPEAKRIEVEFQVRRELALQRERNLEPA